MPLVPPSPPPPPPPPPVPTPMMSVQSMSPVQSRVQVVHLPDDADDVFLSQSTARVTILPFRMIWCLLVSSLWQTNSH